VVASLVEHILLAIMPFVTPLGLQVDTLSEWTLAAQLLSELLERLPTEMTDSLELLPQEEARDDAQTQTQEEGIPLD